MVAIIRMYCIVSFYFNSYSIGRNLYIYIYRDIEEKGLTGQESHPHRMGKEKPALSMGDSFAQNETTTG